MKGTQNGRNMRFTFWRLVSLAGTADRRRVICTYFHEPIDQWATQDSNL